MFISSGLLVKLERVFDTVSTPSTVLTGKADTTSSSTCFKRIFLSINAELSVYSNFNI